MKASLTSLRNIYNLWSLQRADMSEFFQKFAVSCLLIVCIQVKEWFFCLHVAFTGQLAQCSNRASHLHSTACVFRIIVDVELWELFNGKLECGVQNVGSWLEQWWSDQVRFFSQLIPLSQDPRVLSTYCIFLLLNWKGQFWGLYTSRKVS